MARTTRAASYGAHHTHFEDFYAARKHRMWRLYHLLGRGDPAQRLEQDEAEHRKRWARRHRDNAARKLDDLPLDKALYRACSKTHLRQQSRMRLKRAIRDGEWDGLVLPGTADGKRYKRMCTFEW